MTRRASQNEFKLKAHPVVSTIFYKNASKQAVRALVQAAQDSVLLFARLEIPDRWVLQNKTKQKTYIPVQGTKMHCKRIPETLS